MINNNIKPSITLSLNPLYQCNFRCDFCYLSPKQLSDPKKLDLEILKLRLLEISSHDIQIEHVDLYGGEIALLGEDYLNKLDHILQDHGDPTINIITNFSVMTPYFFTEHTDLSVSFDFEARQDHEKVIQNLIFSPKKVSILILATEKILEMDVDQMIATLNTIKTIESVEIKPYSTNQANQHPISHEMYEDFVKEWISRRDSIDFNFTNINQLEKTISDNRNAFSDDHVYITPNGKFSVLEFDDKDDEFFLELETFEDYLSWTRIEKEKIVRNQFCSKCSYLGKCLTEHYREVKSLEESCNGYIKLIDWYKMNSPTHQSYNSQKKILSGKNEPHCHQS